MNGMSDQLRGLVNAALESYHYWRGHDGPVDMRARAEKDRTATYEALERHVAALEAVCGAARAICRRVDADLSVLRNEDWIGSELKQLDVAIDAFDRAGAAS